MKTELAKQKVKKIFDWMRCIKYQRLMEATFVTPQLHRINSSVNKNDKNKSTGQIWLGHGYAFRIEPHVVFMFYLGTCSNCNVFFCSIHFSFEFVRSAHALPFQYALALAFQRIIRKGCLQFLWLRMRSVTWNRFPFFNCFWIHTFRFVESNYLFFNSFYIY